MFEKKKAVEKKAERKSERRRQRGVHGRARQKLTAPPIQGYYTRFVNDIDNKLYEATKLDDFDFASREDVNNQIGEAGDGNSDIGTKVRVLVDKDEQGHPIYAYLLKKPMEFHEEDIAENEERRKGKEDVLRRGNDGIENQYGSIT